MLHRIKKFVHNISLFEYVAALALFQLVLMALMYVDDWSWYITFMPSLILLGAILFLFLVIVYISFKQK